MGERLDPGILTREAFEALTGTVIQVEVTRGEVLEMKVAQAGGASGGGPADDGFSVLFAGPAEPVLPQRMYDMTLGELGTASIFIVPIEQRDGQTIYEAVFTRMRDGPSG